MILPIAPPASSPQDDRFVISRYPCALIDVWRPGTGTALTLRPVLPQDEPLVGRFFASLQPATRYRRFHATVGTLPAERLMQMTTVDYKRHLALVVTTREASVETVIADARYVVDGSDSSGEFAIVVADRWHGMGIGQRVMQALVAAAAGQGLNGLWGDVHESNSPMLALMKRSGFGITTGMAGQGFVRVQRSVGMLPDIALPLRPPPTARLGRLWALFRPAPARSGAGQHQGGEL